MLAGKAVMVNWSNVAPEHRPAYYHWHGSEHMPGRIVIPGYRRGRRFIAREASRDFLVLYEVDDLEVIVGERYLAKANSPSELTRRTTPLVRDSARALARVRGSVGIGQGGCVLTLRFDAADGSRDGLEQAVLQAIAQAGRAAGVVGAHFCVADMAASRMVPVERAGRPTTIPAWIVILEGIDMESLAGAADRFFSPESLERAGAVGPVLRDTYDHQITVLAAEHAQASA